MLLATLVALRASAIAAQEHEAAFDFGAHAVALITRATGTPRARTLTEAYLTQPTVSAQARRAWFRALATLNLEGLTLRRGELDLGAWGEGYVDRRHPHTYFHEVMAGIAPPVGLVRLSLYGGRGFAPFGSDDPMSRPFVSYPVDHHLAQILERLVLIGAIGGGPLTLEAATFNGDEPASPSTAPEYRRFGDSWSLRSTLDGRAFAPALDALELSASYANVKSPEYRAGAGLDQRKAHASLRYADSSRYALVELARTTDVDRGRALYDFGAVLTEGALCRGELGLAARWELSDRPEEERLLDLFRSARPATDVSILGVTRWTTLTVATSLPGVRAGDVRLAPYLEVAYITADRTTAALFDPVRFYGSSRMWRLSFALRLKAGHDHGRMGRYGVASENPSAGGRAASHEHASAPESGSHSRCFS
jgi:hypothetical protein